AQARGAVVHVLRLPELGVGFAVVPVEPRLLDVFDDADVPGADRHDDQDDERAARDEVALLPERFEAIGVVEHLALRAGGVRRGRGCRRRGGRLGFGRRLRLLLLWRLLLLLLRRLRPAFGDHEERCSQKGGEQECCHDAVLVHTSPGHLASLSRHTWITVVHCLIGFPSDPMAGLYLQSFSSDSRDASSRRLEPEDFSIMVSSTLPFTSISNLTRTSPSSPARRAAAG